MFRSVQWVAYKTIVFGEFKRIIRIWAQALLPPVVTTVLYFLIFGQVIGSRVGEMEGFSYMQYIAPGLIMMNVITSAYSAAVGAFFLSKFHGNIQELLVAPVEDITIILGYMSGAMIRGILVGVIVAVISLFFTHLKIYSLITVIMTTLLAAGIFSLAGIINGMFAKTFDDIAIVPTFILTPLTYLGGVFYSISLLPPVWQKISLANPIVYIIDSFRYGFLGVIGIHLSMAMALMAIFLVFLFFWAYGLVKKGIGLRE